MIPQNKPSGTKLHSFYSNSSQPHDLVILMRNSLLLFKYCDFNLNWAKVANDKTVHLFLISFGKLSNVLRSSGKSITIAK